MPQIITQAPFFQSHLINQMEAPICRICKIFFGCQEGLCSKCFREAKQITVPSMTSIFSPEVPKPSPTAASTEEERKESKVAADPSKCFKCSKRLGPVNFKCKCENFFCASHRYPEDHRCSFDHRTDAIRKLSEENPLVEAEKFNRIL